MSEQTFYQRALSELKEAKAEIVRYRAALIDIIEECPNPKWYYGMKIVEIAKKALEKR